MSNEKLNLKAISDYLTVEVYPKDIARELTEIMLKYIHLYGNSVDKEIIEKSQFTNHIYLIRRLRDLMIITAKQNGETNFDELLLLDDTQYLE